MLRGDAMDLTVNGESQQCPDGASVADLLAQRGLDAARVVVERNGSIVPREAVAAEALCAGDSIEIVHFVGGG